MDGPGSRKRLLRFSTVVIAFAVVGVLLALPVGASSTTATTTAASGGPVSYTVLWNGVDVNTAGSPSSALSVDLANSVTVNYYWNVSVGGPSVTINDARLQMYYFGYAIATRDVGISNPTPGSGHVPLTWNPVSVPYLLEGVYRLTASFLAPNGTTMWSENFYVRGTALLGFVALLPIILLILVIYEVYGLVRSGRYAALGGLPKGLPPSTPPSAPETTAPPPEEEAAPPTSATEGAGENPPASGGSS